MIIILSAFVHLGKFTAFFFCLWTDCRWNRKCFLTSFFLAERIWFKWASKIKIFHHEGKNKNPNQLWEGEKEWPIEQRVALNLPNFLYLSHPVRSSSSSAFNYYVISLSLRAQKPVCTERTFYLNSVYIIKNKGKFSVLIWATHCW